MVQTTRSTHLEQARNRLRQRFEAKFLDALKEPPFKPTVAMSAMLNPIQSTSKDSLEEARLRIRQRFNDKFPLTHTDPSVRAVEHESFQEMASPTDNDQEYLEATRKRIHQRFNNKFPDFKSFPVTVDGLQHVIRDTEWGRSNAVVVTSAKPPYPITHVNKAWEGLCGFSEYEVCGKTFRSLGIQGDFTESSAVNTLAKKLSDKERAAVHLTNAAKDGTLFQNYLRVAPLYDNDEITHFIGVLRAQESL